jgi:hypothetical protein
MALLEVLEEFFGGGLWGRTRIYSATTRSGSVYRLKLEAGVYSIKENGKKL